MSYKSDALQNLQSFACIAEEPRQSPPLGAPEALSSKLLKAWPLVSSCEVNSHGRWSHDAAPTTTLDTALFQDLLFCLYHNPPRREFFSRQWVWSPDTIARPGTYVHSPNATEHQVLTCVPSPHAEMSSGRLAHPLVSALSFSSVSLLGLQKYLDRHSLSLRWR
jgi:hypothetical protein